MKNLENFLESMYEKYREKLGYRYYTGNERDKYEGKKKQTNKVIVQL